MAALLTIGKSGFSDGRVQCSSCLFCQLLNNSDSFTMLTEISAIWWVSDTLSSVLCRGSRRCCTAAAGLFAAVGHVYQQAGKRDLKSWGGVSWQAPVWV